MTNFGIPAYNTIVASLLGEIDLLLNNYVYNGYAAFSSYLRIPLGIVSAIYIVILGYSILMGWTRLAMGNFVKAVLKIGLIYMAVTEWDFIAKYFVGFINDAIGGLGDVLVGVSPVNIPGASGLDGAMQVTLTQFTNLGAVVFNTGSFSNLGGWFDGLIIWFFGYAIVGFGLFEIILAKVMLAILFIFTPVIVIFCYFAPLQPIFDRWLGAIIGFALLQLFVTAALALALSISYWWLGVHMGQTALNIGNFGSLPVIIVGLVSLGIVWKAADLAQNLGGVVSTSAASAMIGGAIGSAMGSTLSVAASPFKTAMGSYNLGKKVGGWFGK